MKTDDVEMIDNGNIFYYNFYYLNSRLHKFCVYKINSIDISGDDTEDGK